jgi:hypothetical protein
MTQSVPVVLYHRLKMEVDLQSLFLGSMSCDVHSCTHWLRPCNPPYPSSSTPHWDSYKRALLVSKDRRHLFVTPCTVLCTVPCCRELAGRGRGCRPEPAGGPASPSAPNRNLEKEQQRRCLHCYLERNLIFRNLKNCLPFTWTK